MLQYDVMSEQEAMSERFQLIKEGIYEGVVTASQDTKSSSGNDMMDVTITVYDENGKPHDIRDFLVFTRTMMWKVIHFCDSAGLLKEYEEGKLCSQVAINKRVVVKVSIEEGKEIPSHKLNDRPEGSRYPNKNKIDGYIKKEAQTTVSNNETKNNLMDDDLPF